MPRLDPTKIKEKLRERRGHFPLLAAQLSMSAPELQAALFAESEITDEFLSSLAGAFGCDAKELLPSPETIGPAAYTIEELKQGLELLHNRGRLAWLRLAAWRTVQGFLMSQDDVFQKSPAYWQVSGDAIFDISLLQVLELIHRKGLGIQFVLDTALANASAPDWGVAEHVVSAWVAEDQALLNHWRLKTQGARNYRNKKLAHFDLLHVRPSTELIDLGVIPSDVRDALYDCSKILNRYSSALEDTLCAWNTDDLHNFQLLARVMLLGVDSHRELFKESISIEELDRNMKVIERADARVNRPSHPSVRADQVNDWKWDWLERYKRDFESGRWPTAAKPR